MSILGLCCWKTLLLVVDSWTASQSCTGKNAWWREGDAWLQGSWCCMRDCMSTDQSHSWSVPLKAWLRASCVYGQLLAHSWLAHSCQCTELGRTTHALQCPVTVPGGHSVLLRSRPFLWSWEQMLCLTASQSYAPDIAVQVIWKQLIAASTPFVSTTGSNEEAACGGRGQTQSAHLKGWPGS